ncbi:MAG TPA: hypothetical protein VG097_03290 [Gemmata sp.]|jgi:hypothetical protein|nr:hypothetical protein [Gemmata sp.]
MRNIFALIGILVVGLGGLGWYLGWYKVNVSKNSDGSMQIQTDVDTKKVTTDSSAFFQKVGQMVDDKVNQNGQSGTTPPATTPANTPANTQPANNTPPGNSLSLPSNTLPSIPLPPLTPPNQIP